MDGHGETSIPPLQIRCGRYYYSVDGALFVGKIDNSSLKKLPHSSSQIIFYIFCRVPLKDSIIHQGICDVLVSLLDGVPDHDSREKILFAMLSLYNTCEPVLHKTLSNLQKLENEYLNLAVKDDDGEYFQQIQKNINSLIQQLSLKYEKEEL